MMTYCKLYDKDCIASEATACAYDDGKLLPPGLWHITRNGEAESEIIDVDAMPEHWQKQLSRWTAFGRKLNPPAQR